MGKRLLSLIAMLAAAAAVAQTDKALTIGDPAPAFKVSGWAKGTPVQALEKGNIYVVEFWATWCGPCIQSMPHLSEMADKYKGRATFVSVNTWDWRGPNNSVEEAASHTERVAKFVKENDEKMRYNIALDDSSDTMSTTWMRAAGRNGIPCAFIVNGQGVVAWIGHPMEMEGPLAQIVDGKWDLAAFKEQFDKQMAGARQAAAEEAKLREIAKKADMAALEGSLKKSDPNMVIGIAIQANPDFGIQVLEKFVGKIEAVSPETWCSYAAFLCGSKTASKDLINRSLKIAATSVKKASENQASIAYAYYARCLNTAGKKSEALAALDKALSFVNKFEPKEYQEQVRSFIENTRKEFAGK